MKFEPGFSLIRDGMEYRTIAGNIPGKLKDMLHQFRFLGDYRWYTPPISHGLILARQKYQTEENNYPRSEGYKGGEMLLEAYREACEGDIEKLIERIEEQSRLAWKKRF